MQTPHVRQRLARWQRTGDPPDLWPRLDKQDFLRARDEIGLVTRRMLRGADRAAALEQGFTAYWVETGRVRVSPEVARGHEHHVAQVQHGIVACLALEQIAIEIELRDDPTQSVNWRAVVSPSALLPVTECRSLKGARPASVPGGDWLRPSPTQSTG